MHSKNRKLKQRCLRVLCAAAALAAIPAASFAGVRVRYTVTTVAGTGEHGYSGDAGQATSAMLNYPFGLTLIGSEVLYIADHLNHRIRAVSAEGVITTVAGNGDGGYSGDGSGATSAALQFPCGLALDAQRVLYIADSANHVVRKRSSNGVISKVAGTAEYGYSGDDGTATSAQLNVPMGVAVDAAGNVYISDSANHRIRKVSSSGTITTYAGDGTQAYYGDGGAATSAHLDSPQGIALDAAGNLYIADSSNHCIRKVSTDGVISTVAGNGAAGYSGDGGAAASASLYRPLGVAVDAQGQIFIADTLNNRIRVVAADGTISTIAGTGAYGDSGDGDEALKASFRFPSGIAVGPEGNVYVADTHNSRIRRLTPHTPDEGELASIDLVTSSSAAGGFRAVAPGSWMEIYGSNLASTTREWARADFYGVKAPTALGGTRVTIGGQDAFVSYVSPVQVNVQVPSGVENGSQPVTVTTEIGTSEPYTITVNAVQPGLLAPESFRAGGQQYVAAIAADGFWIAPPEAIPGASSRPARPGETVTIFGTGFGEVTPVSRPGEIVRGVNALELPVRFYFGTTEAEVVYAGLAPGTIGLYQFNVVVPEVAADAAVPLKFTLNDAPGEQTLYTAVGER